MECASTERVILTPKVAVIIMEPPEAPTAISNLESRSMIVGTQDERDRFPG